MIKIYRGDDSDFADLNTITVTITTTLDLTGYTGCFCFLGVVKEFTTEEIAAKTVSFTYTADETSLFTLGQNYGTFMLTDTQGRKAAVQKILVEVLSHRSCAGLPEQTIVIDIENEYDYAKLKNKPKINGVEIVGDKTGRAFGLNKITSYSSASSYSVGDQVLRGTSFYECTTAISSGEEWTESHWRLIGGSADTNAVHYTSDSGKTDAEKSQARTNIGAASASDVALRVKIEDLKAAVTNPKDVLLSPASIKAYLQGIYDAIQAL